MIDKIKGIMRVKEGLDEASSKVEKNIKEVNALAEEIKSLKKGMEMLASAQKDFMQSFEKDKKIISEESLAFKQEIETFKILKKQMQKKVLDDMERDFGNIKNEMRKEITSYSNL